MNKLWLTTEMYQWMLYEKSVSSAPFSPSSTFDKDSTLRDAGYIIDALVYDMTRGGNSQIVTATTAYFTIGSAATFVNTTVANEMPFIVAALTHLNALIRSVLLNVEPAQSFQTLNGIAGSLYISQIIDTRYQVESNTQLVVDSLYSIVITALSTASTALVPRRRTAVKPLLFLLKLARFQKYYQL